MRPLLIRTKIRPFESLSSLVYRLIQTNSYEYPGRIYSLIAPHRKFACHNWINDRDAIRKLSVINKCSEEEIFSTTVHRFANFFSDQNIGFLDTIALRNFVLYLRTKYCPLCLKESGYHKICWDLLPVTICTKHEVILQSICPNCNRPITPYRVLRNKCKCGGDLHSVNPISVASYLELINNQLFIQNLLEIRESGYSKSIFEINNSPSMGLSAPDFFKLLKIFTVILNKFPKDSDFFKLGSITAEPYSWVIMKNGISNFTNFLLFHSAASIMLNWPQKFYEFLDEYQKIAWKSATGMGKHSVLNYLFMDKLSPIKFGFIHSAYSSYWNDQKASGHIPGKIKYLNTQNKKQQKKYITRGETAKILGIGYDNVPRLISQKMIEAVNLKSKTHNRYLIDAESVYSLKKQMDKMLSSPGLADRLDIGCQTVKLLETRGLLPSAKRKKWKSEYAYFFELEDVEKFEKEFLSEERYAVVDKKPPGYLSTIEAIKRIGYYDVNTARLLCLVREGVFNPILCKEDKGLSRLLFSENELKKYRDAGTEEKKDNNKLSVHQAGIIIRLDRRYVQHLINIGLITAAVDNVCEKQKIYIQKKDLDEFRNRYALIGEAAELTGLSTETVFHWIKQGHLKDYSGIPLTRRNKFIILQREDIKRFIQGNDLNIPGSQRGEDES